MGIEDLSGNWPQVLGLLTKPSLTAWLGTLLSWHINILHQAASLINIIAFSISCPCKGECCFLINLFPPHFLSGETKAIGCHIPIPSLHKTVRGAANYYQSLHFTIFHSFIHPSLNCILSPSRAPGIVLAQTNRWSKYENQEITLSEILKWYYKEMCGRIEKT